MLGKTRNKIMSVLLKCLIGFPIILMLVVEVFITSFYLENDIIVIYTAIITTLCWTILFWIFIKFKYYHYIWMSVLLCSFIYMYLMNNQIHNAHEINGCLEIGKVWDDNQKICLD